MISPIDAAKERKMAWWNESMFLACEGYLLAPILFLQSYLMDSSQS